MVSSAIENNRVTVSGKIASNPEFSHEVYGESFYTFIIEIPRLSEYTDKIPVTISERLISTQKLRIGLFVEIEGQFRSYNSFNNENSKLILTVFAREITIHDDVKIVKNPNQIFLDGYICKKPVYRTTPFGREIADILLAVNRPYNKSDYIPCICWGRNARFAEGLQVGDNVKLWGRIQSRTYQKRLADDQLVTKVAYEVSISKMEVNLPKERQFMGDADNKALTDTEKNEQEPTV